MDEKDCLFCKIIRGESKADLQFEDAHVIVIRDIRPQAPTHVLIVPKKHIATSLNLKAEDKDLVGHIYMVANEMAKKGGFAEKGYRVVMNCNPAGGQTVYHIHFHLLGGRFMTWPPG